MSPKGNQNPYYNTLVLSKRLLPPRLGRVACGLREKNQPPAPRSAAPVSRLPQLCRGRASGIVGAGEGMKDDGMAAPEAVGSGDGQALAGECMAL